MMEHSNKDVKQLPKIFSALLSSPRPIKIDALGAPPVPTSCAKADMIITKNLADFPDSILKSHDLIAVHPDLFLLTLIQSSQDHVCASIKSCRARLMNPPKSIAEYLDILEKQDLKQTVATLRELSQLL